ncbi:MAG: LacI family DNA-binding transcriptional regulator [Lachnospiraceae bacterium]|nr:LacI family DNA-binding transcriptional regulator [Lachnospiraceae bacterium]
MVTIKDLANRLNLSSATISRALRNDKTLSITPETKARIFMAAEEMGYVIKEKKATPQEKEKIITVIHKQQTFRNQIDSSYYFSVRTGIEETCAQKHYICNFLAIEQMNEFAPITDAILIVGNYSREQFELIESTYRSVPMATIGIISYSPASIDHITHSNQVSVELALDYLFKNRHEKIGYLGITEAIGTEQFGSRKKHFIRIMQSHGCYNPSWILESEHGRDRVERGYETMLQWLRTTKELPTAFFCANDPIALGALKALHESNISVPEQISLVAHDGSYPTQYSTPPLSTIDVHPFQLGCEGVSLLDERITGKRKIAKKVQFYPDLVIRDSVRKL